MGNWRYDLQIDIKSLRQLSLGVREGNSNLAKSVYALEMY